MAFFGSDWIEDDEDHGPLSHWLEDNNEEYKGLFSHYKDDEDSYESLRSKKYKDDDNPLKPNLE